MFLGKKVGGEGQVDLIVVQCERFISISGWVKLQEGAIDFSLRLVLVLTILFLGGTQF